MSKTYWMNDGVGINESKMNIIYRGCCLCSVWMRKWETVSTVHKG